MSADEVLSRSAPRVERRQLSGWGQVAKSACEIWLPASLPDVGGALVAVEPRGLIARGCGRSYGDESTNDGGRVVAMTALDCIEDFDSATNVIVCQAGVSLQQLVRQYIDRGIVPPVCPGTGFVTVGGAVANDVHGKNHERQGSFGDHVLWIDLLRADGEVQRISMEQHAELFRATIGGAGLTGIMLRVAFRMLSIGTNCLRVREQRIPDIVQFMEALSLADKNSTFSVGWLDAQASGAALGRGILITAEPADAFQTPPKRRTISIPFNLPGWTLNRWSVNIFNNYYFYRKGREYLHDADFERFVFPLDALHNWNRLYGTRGVYQFQCVIPHERAAGAMRLLLEMTVASGAASPLAVLKTLSGRGRGYLSFPMPGFTLALDFPRSPHSGALIKAMYEVTLDNGGRVYLAKDQCLDARQFRLMYPQLGLFEQVLQEIDPRQVMQSDMSRRLAIHRVRESA